MSDPVCCAGIDLTRSIQELPAKAVNLGYTLAMRQQVESVHAIDKKISDFAWYLISSTKQVCAVSVQLIRSTTLNRSWLRLDSMFYVYSSSLSARGFQAEVGLCHSVKPWPSRRVFMIEMFRFFFWFGGRRLGCVCGWGYIFSHTQNSGHSYCLQ